MEFEIKKENFIKEDFDSKHFLNSLLKTNSDAESEILNFKLKILQREFTNELDLNLNNLMKFSKILESDITTANASNKIFLENVNHIMKNKIDNKELEELDKAFKIKNKNKNLIKALHQLEKN